MSDFENAMRAYVNRDRQRKRWRLWFFVLLLVVACVALFPRGKNVTTHPHIAEITVSGFIGLDRDQERRLQAMAENDAIKAVIVYIDTPGGTMPGGLSLFESLRVLAKERPVVAVMDSTAASAGYLVASAADYIIANPATMTGSIGVFMPLFNAEELARKVGVEPAPIVSGRMKLATVPLKRDAAQTAYLQELADDMHAMFKAIIRERRPHIDAALFAQLTDGRVVTGQKAYEAGLVDAVGNQFDAQTWLFNVKGIDKTLPLHEYALQEEQSFLQTLLTSFIPALEKLTARVYGPQAIL